LIPSVYREKTEPYEFRPPDTYLDLIGPAASAPRGAGAVSTPTIYTFLNNEDKQARSAGRRPGEVGVSTEVRDARPWEKLTARVLTSHDLVDTVKGRY
jgi:hypothetical protein